MIRISCVATVFMCLITAVEASSETQLQISDLTKGGMLSRRNPLYVGPAGFQGWVWRVRQGSNEKKDIRQLQVGVIWMECYVEKADSLIL